MIDLVSLCNFGFSLSILSVQKQQNVESMDEFERKTPQIVMKVNYIR